MTKIKYPATDNNVSTRGMNLISEEAASAPISGNRPGLGAGNFLPPGKIQIPNV